jgi:hypothetical protein
VLGRRDGVPRPAGAPPVATRWLTADGIAAATLFPPSLARPDGDPVVSTRLDPRVLALYLEGEPLDGPDLFPGSAKR